MDRQRQNLVQLLVIGLTLGGCASAPPKAAELARPRTTSAPGVAASRYDTAVPNGSAVLDDPSHTIEQAITSASERRGARLAGDPRLLRLAGWVADHLAPDGTLPMQAALDQAARHLGLTEPTPHVVVIASNDPADVGPRLADDIHSLLAEHDYSHYGGIALERDGLSLYVVALVFRFLELAPVPRALPVGATIELSGRLTHGFDSPELAVTRPDGQVIRGAPKSGNGFAFQVPAGARGVYRVEILGESSLGIAVVANFPVYVGEPPRESIDLGSSEPPVKDANEAAQRLLGMINRERERAGLAPLALENGLTKVAAAHNADMLANGFVGHTSPQTGSASQRVERAGFRTALVLENIGRGYSLSEVHAGLMESPGHRGNLLHPQATHAGIAVAVQSESGHSVYLVTQMFIRVTPKLTAQGLPSLLAAINVARANASRPPLQVDPDLGAIAARAAERCFGGDGPGDNAVMQSVREQLQRKSAPAQGVSALMGVASSLSDLAEIDALLDANAQRIGLGLVQGDRPDSPPRSLCAVFLLAQ
jgi:uncharacterized protein YkwD